MADCETAARVFCDFCKKKRTQVGQLSCQHRMCANCFPFYAKKMDKCSICVLAAAEVKREAMKIIDCPKNDPNSHVWTDEKLFCPNEYCAFVGNLSQLSYHRIVCDRKDPRDSQQKDCSDLFDIGAPKSRSAVKTSVFLDILKDTLKAPREDGNPLTVEKIGLLTLEAWDQAELSLRDKLEIDSDLDNELKTDDPKPRTPDAGDRLDEKLDSKTVIEIITTENPKFSAEISDFVDFKHSSPEILDNWDSNDSTSEIDATESDSSYVMTEGLNLNAHVSDVHPESNSQRIDNPKNRVDEHHEFTNEQRGLSVRRRKAGSMGDPSLGVLSNASKRSSIRPNNIDTDRDGSESEREQSSGPNRAFGTQNSPTSRWHIWFITILSCLTLLIGLMSVLFLSPSMAISRQESMRLHPGIYDGPPVFKQPGDSDGYVTWRVKNVSDLVARARFNEKDMRMSELITVRNYKVRLGVGYTYSPKYRVVILWISAFVMKDSARLWPREEIMQLRLEHSDIHSVQSYSFKASHEGKWDEKQRIGRNKLLYCQMEIETTKRLKYMRFTSFMSYEEAVEEGYIENDSIVAGFKLLPWDNDPYAD